MSTLSEMSTSADHGLTSAEAGVRLGEHGRNVLPRAEPPSLAARLVAQLRDPMALLLIAAAAISGLVLREGIDAVAIVAIVIVNAVIALVQEGRAERALEALEAMEAPSALVMRDGRRQRVVAADLVPGDLVHVQAGDRVPADLEVVEAMGLEVDEAILTGESLAVSKVPGGQTGLDVAIGDRAGLMHSGTIVTRGAGAGMVMATGKDTALGRIAQQLKDVRREPTPLQEQLAGLTRRLGVAAVFLAAGTFALTLAVNHDSGADEAFLTAVALAVAAVPEGLAAVTTVALAMGVGRMARRGAIVRRLPAVETLGATDVLVIDKTGTVTENRMRLAAVIAPDGRVFAVDEVPPDLRDALLGPLVLCNDATVDPPTGDPTERALLDLVPSDGPVSRSDDVATRRAQAPRLAAALFTSDRKMMSTVNDLDGALTLLTKGAPEIVLPRCTSTGEARAVLARLADEHAARGERLLAVARRGLDEIPDDVEVAEDALILIGLVALRDPPRTAASRSVEEVRSAGLTLLMATGDHPATASAIASEVGLDTTSVMTGPELREQGLQDDPTTTTVYARVDPDQKLALVTRLQEQGHTVAMTGDGVNDAPALRRADIGVALGATGSDVAREAADLVITDDDLATIVEAVREGRGIYDNLRKVIDYLVASNLAEVAVVIGTLLVLPAFGVPLFPLQLLWINLLTDGLPALALGVDPVDPGVMRRPPRAAASRLLDLAHLRRLGSRAAVLATGAMVALVLAHHVVGLGTVEARTVLFTSLVLSQVLYAFVVHGSTTRGRRVPRNKWLLAAALAALALHTVILLLPAARHIFDTVPPSLPGMALIALGGGAPALILWLTRRRS